jgi:type IV secretion system protein TrbG
MNRFPLHAISAFVLAACAAGSAAHAADASATGALAPSVAAPKIAFERSACPNGQLRTGSRDHLAPTTSRAVAEVLRIDAANRAAVREPARDAYLNAVQVYPWSEGVIYRLYTAPERVSEIALQSGEALISVAAGDTVRWVIGDTTSGSGTERRTHILVKPSATGLETNLIITTDRRLYRVEIESNARSSMAGISWIYPQDALLALKHAEAAAAAAQPVAEGVAVEALNFDYSIQGDQPFWRPVRAFDDGRQVFIQFSANLPQGEAPPLFVVGEGGRAELVNYRLRGLYYVVDRLFSVAELRLGERRQQVVRITRGGDGRQRRARP